MPAKKQNGERVAAAAAAPASAAATQLQQQAAGNRNDQQSMQYADQPQIEPHIAIQDMRELVCDHPLQFVA
jgi:hypothetical protein